MERPHTDVVIKGDKPYRTERVLSLVPWPQETKSSTSRLKTRTCDSKKRGQVECEVGVE